MRFSMRRVVFCISLVFFLSAFRSVRKHKGRKAAVSASLHIQPELPDPVPHRHPGDTEQPGRLGLVAA